MNKNLQLNVPRTNEAKIKYVAALKMSNQSNRVYQFVLTKVVNGRGWSHPIHLHDHYFYVMNRIWNL